MKKFIFAILSVNLLFGYGICFEPTEPRCVNWDFNSQYDFENCQRQVRRYLQELQEYAQCVANEIVKKQNEVIMKFNCRASGESYCY